MAAKPFDLFERFFLDIAPKVVELGGVCGACKHEVLPDEETQLVLSKSCSLACNLLFRDPGRRRTHASFVKDVLFVHATTPDSDHRLIPIPRHLQQASVARLRTVREEGIDRDPVAPAEEEWGVVQKEDESMAVFAVWKWRPDEFDSAEANFASHGIEDLTVPLCGRDGVKSQSRASCEAHGRGPTYFVHQIQLYIVERLLPLTVRPPELDLVRVEGPFRFFIVLSAPARLTDFGAAM